MSFTGRGPIAALALLCCTPTPPPTVAKFWPTETFFSAPRATFSGFPTKQLISIDGGIPWRTGEYEAPPAVSDGTWSLAVQPAFQNGDVAAYVVTEIWDTHPDPWIQPVYNVTHDGQVLSSVFGVGVDSTFYSPFWRIYDAELTTQNGPFTTVADIVDKGLTVTKGPIWVCPIVPANLTGYAASVLDGVPVRPFSHEPVTLPEVGRANADGAPMAFLNFGERQVGEVYEEGADGVVDAEDFYVFARAQPDGGRTPLALPAVLADDAQVHAYVRRVDVLLAGEAVFVPADKTALRAEVAAFLGDVDGGVAIGHVPVPDALISTPLAEKYTLRVALDGSCFADHTMFPQGCTWLDSEAAIDALPPSRVLDSTVTLTATPVLLGGQKL